MVKKQKAEISDHIVAAVKADIFFFSGLHDEDSMTFNGREPLIRVTAGLIRVSARVTKHTAGR